MFVFFGRCRHLPISIALSSKTLKWSSSAICQRPRDGDILLVISQTARLAFVCMVMAGFGMLLNGGMNCW